MESSLDYVSTIAVVCPQKSVSLYRIEVNNRKFILRLDSFVKVRCDLQFNPLRKRAASLITLNGNFEVIVASSGTGVLDQRRFHLYR